MTTPSPTLWLEDFKPGTVFSGGPRKIVERDLLYCTLWCGDGQPHSNEEYSRQSPWGSRILHGDGMLAVGMGLIQKQGMFDESLADCKAMAIRYPRPVYVGDEISSKMTVKSVEKAGSADGMVVIDLAITNETKATTSIEATIHYVVKRRP